MKEAIIRKFNISFFKESHRSEYLLLKHLRKHFILE